MTGSASSRGESSGGVSSRGESLGRASSRGESSGASHRGVRHRVARRRHLPQGRQQLEQALSGGWSTTTATSMCNEYLKIDTNTSKLLNQYIYFGAVHTNAKTFLTGKYVISSCTFWE